MALTVVKRPQGYINSPTSATGTYTNASSTVTKTAHGLSTGNFIYISSNQATGFWYVTVLTADTFTISEYSGATVYTFIGAGTFSYYLNVLTHGWNAVHLPILYKLTSNLWPTNSVDTAQTVSSYANDNGYVKITAGGTIKSDITELEFVKITYVGGTTAIYQVLGWYSSSIVTINLPYVLGITFSTIQYYYNNYNARIRVYAGLTPTHTFASQKPYVLITEQKEVPDSNGVIVFNVAEFLKQQINILKNDLLKGTLPNNIDSLCQFYITYAEGYDYSTGGYSLLDYIGAYTDDSATFTGYATNSDLPFKNIYSGFMSDYVYGASTNKQKFLTPSLFPELIVGQYFDISYINTFGTGLRMKREAYQNGTVVNLFFDSISNYDIGIYRYSVSQSVYLEDRIDLTLQKTDGTVLSETKTITVVPSCTKFTNYNVCWLNYLGAFDWKTFQSSSDLGVNIEGTKTVNKNIFPDWPKSFGETADTIKQETSRQAISTITLRAENQTEDQIKDLYRLKTSPLVQIVNAANDKRTIIPDASSFVYFKQREKAFTFEFTAEFTDNISSPSL